ncbi:putative nucleotidyltransferase substrate binding domain-containing protein [Pseudonocardia sp. TRM90224]|uniref:putative nucleotidyltransferase substrate binding domain-containing protein n=1 Tax=Pseudonocardia sp. TRM90224 TaxID=2812678 RepID=UPI001E452823|nr:putative nucleotidyltransferase substrate binding domain-containing protein [Pseudonocardia sp. TRM90224]
MEATGGAVELAAFLARHPPFDSVGATALDAIAEGSVLERFAEGELVLDAFRDPTVEVFVVIEGHVQLWNNADTRLEGPDEVVSPGGMFGFSAMLTERSIGPRAVAAGAVLVARIPAALAAPVFTSSRGARFLAEMVSSARRRVPAAAAPTYMLVDDLIVRPPLVVDPDLPIGEVARRMTADGGPAAVPLGDGRFGLVTDAVLRTRVLLGADQPGSPVRSIVDTSAPVAVLGDSAAEAHMLILDRDAEFLLVTDRDGELRGVVAPRDFAVSPTAAGMSVHEQLRRAATVEDLACHATDIPTMLDDLLSNGLASGRVIAVYSSVVDTLVRRALGFVFARHPELSVDAFTWLSLGSNGRREAVLSSDVDSAAAFDGPVPEDGIAGYRAAFGEVYDVLAQAGLSADDHGATARHALFARTNDEWRAAGREWMAAPEAHNGAMMTSLLVDGRPIHGDPGLPAVTQVFGDLRRHPGTMRLLLQESLSKRAKLRSMRHILSRRPDTFDIKAHALVPVVNIARWAALSVGSAALPTVERLRAAAGSAMLPDEQAGTLIEVFGVLQRLRLRYQLMQHAVGDRPSDLITMSRMSSIDRSVIAQAVREISAVQRRMDNVAQYVPTKEWASR